MIFPGLFAIAVGAGMIGQWSTTYFKGQIPELETEPIRIKFHLAGELVTALLLILGGLGLLVGTTWTHLIFLVALGMLLYTLIVSPGYFGQKGQWSVVAMFAGLLVLAILSLILVWRNTILIG